jgi:hypothetical protein
VFATTALMEYLAIATGFDDSPDYSEQWMFWLAQTKFATLEGTVEDTGFSRGAANVAAAKLGIPNGAAWPYEPQYWSLKGGHRECAGDPQPLACYTDGAPPPAALSAPRFFLNGTVSGIPVTSIKAWLATHGSPVIASAPVYCQAWNLACAKGAASLDDFHQGYVTHPNAGDRVIGAHEFLIVGWDDVTPVPMRDIHGNAVYEDDGVTPVMETGFYIFKNSWAANNFGRDNLYAPGFGLISQRYMNEYGGSAAVANDDATIEPATP